MQGAKREEMSIADFMNQVKDIFSFLISNWSKILVVAMIGSCIGLTYAFLRPVKYISKITFVLEEGKAAGSLASLAGQFGFDLGGMSGGSVFSGDNILLFLKSESLCRETLMTVFDEKGDEVLADVYSRSRGLKKKWRNNKKIGEITFAKYKGQALPRLEDSLMQLIINDYILEEDLVVMKPEKKASFIVVSSSMRNEQLSKVFTERLVNIAIQRYIESKTKIKQTNVDILQRRADSLASILNNRTYIAATTQQTLVDVNPALRTVPILSEISSREKAITATIFSEVIKNLEIAKTILNQEIPVVQMVDQSYLPLEKDKVGKLISMLVGGFLFGFFSVLKLLTTRFVKDQHS